MKVSKSLVVGDLSFKYTYRSDPALGLIVSKNYGNSVDRNLFKRRCRYLFRNILINQGIDIALIVRPENQNIPFAEIKNSFRDLYEKISV